jgi:hypothetical protein
MLKFLIDSQMHVVPLDAAQETVRFIRDAGIHLEAGEKPRVHSPRVIACKFGEPNPDNRYQQVIHSRVIDPDEYGVIPSPTPDRQGPLGLRYEEKTRSVWRGVGGSTKPAEFNGKSIAFRIFVYLYHHTDHCSNKELMDHAWGPGLGDIDSLRHHIGLIKKLLAPLGVTVNCRRSVGYILAECNSGLSRVLKNRRRSMK